MESRKAFLQYLHREYITCDWYFVYMYDDTDMHTPVVLGPIIRNGRGHK